MKVIFRKLGEESEATKIGKEYEVISFNQKDGRINAVFIDEEGEDNYHMEESDSEWFIVLGEE